MKIAIYGYGNLGRGVECALAQNPDVQAVGIFTRRKPEDIHPQTDIPVYAADEVGRFKDEIDVLVLCGGSATDLPEMTPRLAADFNVIDSFDTHAVIPRHFAAVDSAARESGHLALISAGWDPGLFSLARLYATAILPEGSGETFWGRGVSQGHSDAIRRIPGVLDARQYTVPIDEAVELARAGRSEGLCARQKHRRECYVVAEEGADRAEIERQIKEMPHYFADYDTTVTFIDRAEMQAHHAELPHGGCVIRCGKTGIGEGHRAQTELRLTLGSNPEFTANILLAYARAVARKHARGERGCVTVFDVAPADLLAVSGEELRAHYL